MAPSSSGLGHRVLIPKIRGSNPLGATTSTPEFIRTKYLVKYTGGTKKSRHPDHTNYQDLLLPALFLSHLY